VAVHNVHLFIDIEFTYSTLYDIEI